MSRLDTSQNYLSLSINDEKFELIFLKQCYKSKSQDHLREVGCWKDLCLFRLSLVQVLSFSEILKILLSH